MSRALFSILPQATPARDRSRGAKFLARACFALLALGSLAACAGKEATPEQLAARAEQAIASGNATEAVELWRRATAARPENDAWRESLALALDATQEHFAAAEAFFYLARQQPEREELYLYASESYDRADEPALAALSLARFIEGKPGNSRIWQRLAELHAAGGDPEAAIEAALESHRRSPRPAVARFLSEQYAATGNDRQAALWRNEAGLAADEPTPQAPALEPASEPPATAEMPLVATTPNAQPPAARVAYEEFSSVAYVSKEEAVAAVEASFEAVPLAEEEDEEAPAPPPEEATAPAVRMPPLTAEEPREHALDAPLPTLRMPLGTLETMDKESAVAAAEASFASALSALEGSDFAVTIEEEIPEPETEAAQEPENAQVIELPPSPEIEQVVEIAPPGRSLMAGLSEPMERADRLLAEARALHQEGRLGQAVEAYYASLTLNDGDPEVWLEISRLHLEMGEPLWAETTALEAQRRAPFSVRYTLQVLRAAQQTKQPEEFLRELQEAHRTFPGEADLTLALARAYRDISGNRHAAAELLRQFLAQASAFHPERDIAEAELARLLEAGD